MWLFMLTAIACAMPVLADGEQKAVEDLEAKIKALEARISESDTRAADAMKKSREWGKKADDFKTLGRQKNNEFNLKRCRKILHLFCFLENL
jgi:Skp family chaperone for outer membrane proteins